MDPSNYATKADLKRDTCIGTSTIASEKELSSLKTKADNLDVDKLKAVPGDLSMIVYNKSVIKVNGNDTKITSTSGLFAKTMYDSENQCLQKKIEDGDK